MNLKNIYHISSRVLFYPVSVWDEISARNMKRGDLIREVLLPFSFLVGLFAIFGIAFSSRIEDGFLFGFLLLNGMISFLVIFMEIYLAGWLINELAKQFEAKTDPDEIFNLVVFSHIPFILTLAVTKLFPSLIFLNLLGIYTFFLYWSGMERFAKIKDQFRPLFMIFSILIMVVLYLLLTMIFNSVYDAILMRFATFGS